MKNKKMIFFVMYINILNNSMNKINVIKNFKFI